MSAPPLPPPVSPEPPRGAWRHERLQPSLPESHRSIGVPLGGPAWRKAFAFLGPGYLVAVGYMDPGNWATDLAGGARYGYALLSVVLLSNLMAILLQGLSLRLGIATGRDLAQACRDAFPRPVAIALWLFAEVAIAACDLAEVIGSAIALQLLFGIPLLAGVVITVADVMVVLLLQRFGFRWLEVFVVVLLLTIAGCFAVELWFARPPVGQVLAGLVPRAQILRDPAMLYIAVGILGATVMPHNLYLHSSVVQTRAIGASEADRREAIRWASVDSALALLFAFLVNAAILVLAAATFHGSGHHEVADIADAHRLLAPLLGSAAASILFAVALLASGQNSTVTGTLAGQIVMEGFLDLRLPAWMRRLITRAVAIVPAIFVVALKGEGGAASLLVLSQVILSLQLPFAVVPLVLFTGSRARMGSLVAGPVTRGLAWFVAAVILGLNGWLLWGMATG